MFLALLERERARWTIASGKYGNKLTSPRSNSGHLLAVEDHAATVLSSCKGIKSLVDFI